MSSMSFQDCLNPLCFCGNEIETSTHYLLHCPTYTNERLTLLNKIKSINCSILESSDAAVTKTLLFGDNTLSNSSYHNFELNNWIHHIYSKIWGLHLNSRIIIKKHYLAFLLAFILFYFWKDLVILVYLILVQINFNPSLVFPGSISIKITWWL